MDDLKQAAATCGDARMGRGRRLSFGQRRRVRTGAWLDARRKQHAWRIAVDVFWVFVACSVAGLVIEVLYHFAVYHEWQGREGLLFGPFSPLYGVGGVCVAVLARIMEGRPLPAVFFSFAAMGGALEFAASWAMQTAFGIIAWDYSGTWLSLGGRTNGFYMCLWGVLGILCARFALPLFERKLAPLLARIPNAVNVACMALMAVNVALTLVAFNCWYHRLAGEAPETPVQVLFAEHAGDAYMADRFEVMSLYPQDAHRSPEEG